MSDITKQTVKQMARAARISLNEDDLQAYTKTLQNMFDLSQQLKQEDVLSLSPMAHPFETEPIVRSDHIEADPQILQSFHATHPHFEKGFYDVPAVVDESL